MKVLGMLMLFFLFTTSCDRLPFHSKEAFIVIHNNSGKDVFYKLSQIYPDTTVGDSKYIYPLTVKNGHANFGLDTKTHEEYFAQTPQGIISVFFFDGDTVERYGKEEVAKNHKVLARKDFSYQELKDNNFTINYP